MRWTNCVIPDWLAPSASASAVKRIGPSRFNRFSTSAALALRSSRSTRYRHISVGPERDHLGNGIDTAADLLVP